MLENYKPPFFTKERSPTGSPPANLKEAVLSLFNDNVEFWTAPKTDGNNSIEKWRRTLTAPNQMKFDRLNQKIHTALSDSMCLDSFNEAMDQLRARNTNAISQLLETHPRIVKIFTRANRMEELMGLILYYNAAVRPTTPPQNENNNEDFVGRPRSRTIRSKASAPPEMLPSYSDHMAASAAAAATQAPPTGGRRRSRTIRSLETAPRGMLPPLPHQEATPEKPEFGGLKERTGRRPAAASISKRSLFTPAMSSFSEDEAAAAEYDGKENTDRHITTHF